MGRFQLPFRLLTRTEFGELSPEDKIRYVIGAVEQLEPRDFNRMMDVLGVGAYYAFFRNGESDAAKHN